MNRGHAFGWLVFVALCLAAAAPYARAEDCIPINPGRVDVRLMSGRWKVVDGSSILLDYGLVKAEAEKARDVIKHYQFTKQCFVGRPNAPMMYFRTANGFPQGAMAGQDCITVNPHNARVALINGRWKVVDCDNWLLDFSANPVNANAANNLIHANRLRQQCFVGRPNAPMQYWLAEPQFAPVTQVSLNVTMHPQETSMWCWAASGQMSMDFLGNNVAQCTEANNRFGRTDCCTIQLCPTPVQNHACVTGGWPEFNKYNFDFKVTSNKALSWDELWRQIYCLRKPVAFSWHWPGGGGHMMVVRGLHTSADGTRWVDIHDPWAPCNGNTRAITYAAYVEVVNDHTHWNDYYDITRR